MSKAPTTSSSESNFLSPGETAEVGDLRVPAALACLSAFCLWVIPIGSSLWLDELVTFWSSYKGIVPAIARSQFWPGENTAYTVLIASIIRVAGTSEVVLRLPSLIAIVLTAWLLFRLGETFLDKEAGILVVVVFTSLHEVARQAATNARPYSIALTLVVASMLQLVRWLDSQRLRNMAGFTVAAAAIPYFHLMFATIYLVFFAYGVYRWLTERRIRIKHIALAAVVIALLLAPLLWYTLFAHRLSARSSWAGTPDAQELVSAFMPSVLASTLLLGLLAGSFACRRTAAALLPIPRSTAFLFMSWLILPVVTAFVVARVTPLKILVPRYFLPAFAALALIIGCGLRMLTSARMRALIAAFVAVGSIISYAGYHLNASPHHEDWRAAAKIVRSLDLPPTTPVMLSVGLVETATIRSDVQIDRDSPLLCPLSKYPIPGRIVLIPYRLNPDSIRYMQEISSQILAADDTFVVVARKNEEFIPWIGGWFRAQGFESSEVGHAEGVPVFLYRRLHH
ncbi:MAG TPA: glycosyltransferase family 39 protein [Candidatus Acidoferrum sp.]|nr:glycosyltransferase family 39 protein [Candidatus Acidoferrum sp.]